jgi:hypothetical protein
MVYQHTSAASTDSDLEDVDFAKKAMESRFGSDDCIEQIWTPEEERAVV